MMSMGSSVDVFKKNQHEWQVHYFDALKTKPGPDNDKFHDTLEQFADDPDSVIDLVVYRANRACYVCDHETVEAAPKFVMTLEPDYGQLRPRLGWLPVDAIKKMFECTTQLAHMPNFIMPWSNLQMTQIASSTSSSTMLIVHITFATMRQWRLLLSSS
jgi:hypothetical protein